MWKIISSVVITLLIGALAFAGYSYFALRTESQRETLQDSVKLASLSQQLIDSQKATADSAVKAYNLEAKVLTLQTQMKQLQTNDEQQKQSLPIPIVESLNDMLSALQTGISKDTYSTKLIAIKTAVSTYGNNLPVDKTNALTQIIGDYDLALYFWNKQGGALGFIDIFQSNDFLYKRDKKILADAGIPSVTDEPSHFLPDRVLKKFWGMGARETNSLLQNQGTSP